MAALCPGALFVLLNFTVKYSNMLQLLAENVNRRVKLSDKSLPNCSQRILFILKFTLTYISHL